MRSSRFAIPGMEPAERRRRMQAWRRQRKKPQPFNPSQLDFFCDLDPETKCPAEAGPKANNNDD